MDDDLFADALEPDKREAEQKPRVAIASQPIRDGSRALPPDGYDVQLFHEAAGEYPRLAELISNARERLITAPALICDLFWSFFKHAPEIRPVAPLTPAYQLHANILEQLMATREWHAVRAAESALGALSAAVVAEINHLRELFAQAAKARAEAEELAHAEEQAAAELAE